MREIFYGLNEAAEVIGFSEQSVRRWVKSGELPAYKLGKEYRISQEDLDKFLEARRVPTPKAVAQPSEAEPEAARDPTPWDRLQSFIKGAEATCTHWEARLDDEGGLSNDEVRSLASFDWTLALALERLTDAELRDLRYQYPDVDDVRQLSTLEPVRHRWAGVMIRVARLSLKNYPKPEDRQMFREGMEEVESLVDSKHVQQ